MTFLTRFPDFLCPDFRLREVLVDQLVPVVSLFSACDILTFILPVVILVLQDKIAAVRQKAINLVRTVLFFSLFQDFALSPTSCLVK